MPIGIKFGFLQCGTNVDNGFNKTNIYRQEHMYSSIFITIAYGLFEFNMVDNININPKPVIAF